MYFQLQVGPALFKMGKRQLTHVFDGFAKINKFTFRSGQAFYSNHFIMSHYYNDSVLNDDIAPYLLYDKAVPPFNPMDHILGIFNGFDNMNVNVKQLGEDVTVLTDFWKCYTVNPTTLDTLERVDPPLPFGSIKHYPIIPLPSSAHPVKEANGPDHVTFVAIASPLPFTKSYIHVVRVTSATDRQLIASIERDYNTLPYMHSLALSMNYAILFAHPLFFNVSPFKLFRVGIDALEWKPHLPTDVYVIRLADGQVTKLQTDALFFMHHVNSYEEGADIITDYTTYPDAQLLRGLEIATQLNSTKRDALHGPAGMKRIRINVKKGTLSLTQFEATPGAEAANNLDLPVISEHFAHKRHCFVYGVSVKADNKHFASSGLSKKNVCTRNGDKLWSKPNHYPAEPFFIPRPGSTKEDDGLLASVILDGERHKSYVGVFEAKTMQQISQSELPDVVPFLIHGHLFPRLPV